MRLRITKRGRRLAYLGIVLYLVFLFISIPASFLTRYVLPAIPAAKSVELHSVSGSIWQGQAINANVNRFNLGQLNWELSGWGLLLGDIDLDLRFRDNDTNGSGSLSVGFGGAIDAEDVTVKFPAEALTPLFYGFPVSLSGELNGNIKTLELEPGRTIKTTGRIVWRSASLRSPQNIDLGDYVIVLEPSNRGTKFTINDSNKGPIETNITLTIKGNGEYRLNGWLKARDEEQQHITEALRLVGRADNSGRFWVTRNGLLRGWRN